LRIELTEEARHRLLAIMQAENKAIQLAYDISGCGCAVSGVPSLWLIHPTAQHSLTNAGDEQLPIFYDKQQAVFFEPTMKLGFNVEKNGFRLSSNNQIYRTAMSVTQPPSATIYSM